MAERQQRLGTVAAAMLMFSI